MTTATVFAGKIRTIHAGTGGSFDPKGPFAAEITELWWVLLTLGAIVYVGVIAFLVAGLFRRDGWTDSSGTGPAIPSKSIVIGGVVMPVIVLAAVFGFSLASTSAIPHEIPEDAVVVEIIGHQWWWEVHYEGHEFATANEIHIPVDEPVGIRLTSADVIHSFWVPQLAGKIDALPDNVNTLVIQADEPSLYDGRCAEFCGLQHTNMGIKVIAEPRVEFEIWLARQDETAMVPETGAAAKGFDVFLDSGCADCHTIEGTVADGDGGPDLTHVGSRKTLAAATIPNTPDHLAAWVSNPQAIKRGTQMPDIALSEADLDALVTFLGTLK